MSSANHEDANLGFFSEFLDEATDCVERCSDLFLKMETDGAAPKLVNEAFRLVQTIKGSSAQLGLTHLSKCAHKLEEKLENMQQAEYRKLSGTQIDSLLAWVDFVQAYIRGLRLDQNFQIEMDDFLQLVPDAVENRRTPSSDGFENANDVSKHFSDSMPMVENEVSPPVNADKSSIGARLNHADSNLHFRALLNSHRSSPEEAQLLANMVTTIGFKVRSGSFASRVLSELQVHPRMQSLARVGLVRRIGLANQLEVVSSAGSSSVNLMKEGYRCFVAPGGSLFKLSTHNFRTFGSAPLIVEKYKAAGQRPQRSIERIAKMGLESGVCSGIFSGDYLQGMIFLNATDGILAELPEYELPVISYLTVAGKMELGLIPEPLYFAVFQPEPERVVGAIFSADRLVDDIRYIASRLDPTVMPLNIMVSGNARIESLIVHAHAAFTLVRFAFVTRSKNMQVSVDMNEDCIIIRCDYSGGSELEPSSPFLPVIIEHAQLLGYSVKKITPRGISLVTSADIVGSDKDVLYSVEASTDGAYRSNGSLDRPF